MAEALRIALKRQTVGVLTWVDETSECVFTFDAEWLDSDPRPVLGQVFEDRLPDPVEHRGMPAWFANLLPQGELREVLARELRTGPRDGYGLLAGLGGDLPGAVVAEPISPLRRGTGDAPTATQEVNRPVFGLKFSLAGLQLKLSLRRSGDRFTVPARDAQGRCLAKFAPRNLPQLPRLEQATMLWAQSAGLTVAATQIAAATEIENLPAGFADGPADVLIVQRFDRGGDTLDDRIHMEDFAQILDLPPGDRQYSGNHENVAAILSSIAPEDVARYVHQLVFVVMSGNGDAHLKNWSVLYPDGRNARLSPAYDLVPTVLVLPQDDLALALGGTRGFAGIRASSFRRLAAMVGHDWPEVRGWVTEAVERTLAAWQSGPPRELLTADERARLQQHLDRVPLAQGR